MQISDAVLAALLTLIHDRMTESVFDSLGAEARLFEHFPAQPLAIVDLLGRGRSAIEAADASLGLALSHDEIDYLARYFLGEKRNATDVDLMLFAQATSE